MNGTLRVALLGASALAITAAGCSRSEFTEATAPQSAYVEAPASAPAAAPSGRIQTTELLGGPTPSSGPSATASIPPPPRITSLPPSYGTMAPIPNPEDMTSAQRARVYGQNSVATAAAYGSPAYAAPEQTARVDGQRRPRRVTTPNRPAVSNTARPAVAGPAGPTSTRPVTPAPKAAPVVKAAPAAPVIAAKPAAPASKPAAPAVAVAPAPAKPVAPVAPAAPAAKPVAPAVAAAPAPTKPAAPVLPAKPQTKAEQLGAALAADVATGLKFDIPANLVTGEDSIVTATLPDGLLERAQAEAAKLGLTVPARSVDARATLSGEGYAFVPNLAQVARLQKGEATTFSWQVRPTGESREPLKLELGGELKGGAKPQAFPITTIEKAVVAPAPAEPAKKGFSVSEFFKNLFGRKDGAPAPTADVAAPTTPAAKGPSLLDRLSIPGRETVVTPVFGEVKSSNLVLGGLGVLLAIVLAALAGQASARRKSAERRRKFRTMADFGAAETVEQPEAEPERVYHAPEPQPAPAPVAETKAEEVQAEEVQADEVRAEEQAAAAQDDNTVVHAHDGERARREPEHV